MEKWAALAILLIGFCTAADAKDLVITVIDQDGHPVPEAIITLDVPSAHGVTHEQVTIDQQDEAFDRLVSLVRPGGKVSFSNSDETQHHVYSFAPINPFEFLVKPGERSPESVFNEVGIAAVGCNVHDNMITYIFVTDLPFAAKTDEKGRARIVNVPEQGAEMALWHPRSTVRRQTVRRQFAEWPLDGNVIFDITLKTERKRETRY